MGIPVIQSTGSSSGAGIAGEGRNDLVAGETVDLTDENPDNVGAIYLWEFEDVPLGTSPTMNNATTATPSFNVDANPSLAGSYRVRCTVNGVEASVEVYGKPLPTTGGRIPSFQETLEYDGASNAKGWHEALTGFMRGADGRLPQKTTEEILRFEIAGRETHNSDTPLVVGAISFNPDDYDIDNVTLQVLFVVHAANGTTPLTTHVELYNVTDSEVVTSSVVDIIDTTSVARYQPVLSIGNGAGQIKQGSERIYECRVFLDAAPGDPTLDTIELFKAELKIIQTVV